MNYDQSWDIYRVVSGSRAYGTHTEDSDRDEKAVCIPPREYFLSFHKRFEQHETTEPDSVSYEIRKFFRLARDCNPNIVEVLFCNKEHILTMDSLGEELRENATLFLSKKAKHTFTGYAQAQLKRLKNHKKWKDNPPQVPAGGRVPMGKGEVKQIDFFCSFSADRFPTHQDQEKVKAHFGMSKAMAWFHSKTYYLKVKERRKYEEWKTNRNSERYALESKYGYDTKHAYHCVRLLRMGVEILESGKVLVFRPDREELLSIRNGKWEYDRLIEESETLMGKVTQLYSSEDGSCVLRDAPEVEKLDNLCMKLIERKWSSL